MHANTTHLKNNTESKQKVIVYERKTPLLSSQSIAENIGQKSNLQSVSSVASFIFLRLLPRKTLSLVLNNENKHSMQNHS